MKVHRFFAVLSFACLAVFVTANTFGGESLYTGPGSENAKPQPKPAPPQDYTYYCWARSIDGTTEYQTDFMSEPTPHNTAFINQASQAWTDHLTATVGKYKTVGECYDGPTATSKPVWEQSLAQPGRKKPIHVDWHFG